MINNFGGRGFIFGAYLSAAITIFGQRPQSACVKEEILKIAKKFEITR